MSALVARRSGVTPEEDLCQDAAAPVCSEWHCGGLESSVRLQSIDVVLPLAEITLA